MISPELLRRFPLFAGLDPATLKEIAMAGEEVELRKGEWLFHQNDEADALYLIVSGALDPTISVDTNGLEYDRLPRLIEGDVMGWSALVEPRIYKFGGVAATGTKVVRLEADQLLELMDKNPQTGYTMMRRLAQVIGERLTNLRIQFVSMTEHSG